MKSCPPRLSRAFGWRASQFPREFKSIAGVRHSAQSPDLVKNYGSFDKFLANEPCLRMCFRTRIG